MAMEKVYMVRDAHTRSVTAVGFNPVRRELLIGAEDGVVKSFELESGKLTATFYEHKGWVTDFLYWSETKLILSSANDGDILAWGIGGGVTDRVKIGIPVFCITLLPRRHQLMCGVNGAIRVYALDDDRESGHVLSSRPLYLLPEHTDIVRCIICLDNRVFTAGYSNKLVIYDCSAEKKRLAPVFNQQVHTAGITCMTIVADIENVWVLTGSFDKTVKFWTVEGSLVQTLDNYPGTVTGVIYVPRNKTVWVAAGAPYAWLHEPKSGDKVSDFIGTFQNMEDEKYHLLILKYFPEINTAVASTSRRQVIVWKYNTAGCVTALKCAGPIESLSYTAKIPILIFSGDNAGTITKWERNQSNPFMYNKETFIVGDMEKLRIEGDRVAKEEKEEKEEKGRREKHPLAPDADFNRVAKCKRAPVSRYAFGKVTVSSKVSSKVHPNTTILKIIFIEYLDYIVAASEDGNIYVWGFDDSTVEVLKAMRPTGVDDLVQRYSVLLDKTSPLLNPKSSAADDSVSNRVAGFTCKFVLASHMGCVTSLVTVDRCFKWESTFVLSGGWDRRVCLWDMENVCLKTVFRNSHATSNVANAASYNLEMACDGIINDMAFSPNTSEFACASSDKMVYIRKFNTNGTRMFIVNTLQGHDGEVTSVKWSTVRSKWVTGSEDCTVRIWNGQGLNECEQILTMTKGITCVCIDQFIGAIIVGVHNDIRVYHPDTYCQVQSNLGHMDSVRSIIHVPERHQYVSCSWDGTVRVWNDWKLPRVKREEDPVGAGAIGRAAARRRDRNDGIKKLVARGLKAVSEQIAKTVVVARRLTNREGNEMGEDDDKDKEGN